MAKLNASLSVIGYNVTLREYAAVAAMQGLIPTYKGNASFDDAGAEHLANQCVYLADALLARLEEKQ